MGIMGIMGVMGVMGVMRVMGWRVVIGDSEVGWV
jgi:hypothetical protein